MKILLKHGVSEHWVSQNPVLEAGEVGIETDTSKFKIGDGTKPWLDLGYSGLASGDFTQCRPVLLGSTDPAQQFVPAETHKASVVDSKRLVLNGGANPSTVGDLDASFGGIVLKGFRDHFWLYDYANNAWNTSDNINLSCETGILIDNKKALDEQKVRVGNRTKGGKLYLGSGEHDSWRLGTNAQGELVTEYRRLDGQWVEKGKITLSETDKGSSLPEAENPYIEHSGEPAKKPAPFDSSTNAGRMSWPSYSTDPNIPNDLLNVTLELNTDDAFALGHIMTRTANFNGVIPGPLLTAKPGDRIAVEFKNEVEDLSEIEPWSDGGMQRMEALHAHIDDRAYTTESNQNTDQAVIDANTIWMSHVMQRNQTNLHTHGFHVRADMFGDNVMRSVKSGSKLRYLYEIPDSHFGGLQWYHPHGHGGSMNVVGRGAAGLIMIEGPYQNRLKAAGVEREFVALQRIQWADNLNGHNELTWVDYVSNLPLDMYDPHATPSADGQKVSSVQPKDLSPYYRDNLDPKCICSCAALEGNVPHVHTNSSMATPSCIPVDVRWVPAVNGQKRPVYSAKTGELKIFSMVNMTGITFFRIAVKDHDIVIVGKDGIPQLPTGTINAVPLDPDFVMNPAGQRLNYVIIIPGQRFEFFAIPKSGVSVSSGDVYPIYTLPVSETELFDKLDAPVQIASLKYDGSLDSSASNHVAKLLDRTLLPQFGLDSPISKDEDHSDLQYLTTETHAQVFAGKPTEWTITGASVTTDGSSATVVMPDDSPHHLEIGVKLRINSVEYVISEISPTDAATFVISNLPGSTTTLPASGTYDFTYDLWKNSTVSNASTGNAPLEIVEVLTDHYYYHNIELPTDALEGYISRRRHFSFAIHGRGIAGMGSMSTYMNGSPYSDFTRPVAYLNTSEEYIVENLSDVIHGFHVHIFYFQIMGYRDAKFGANNVVNPAPGSNTAYSSYANEIAISGVQFEDTATTPVGTLEEDPNNQVVKDEANAGSRGEIRLRTKYEDYVGLFLMHCHLLDDQDMGMMQHFEVVKPGYTQAPFGSHKH
jgi:hypothetical protein